MVSVLAVFNVNKARDERGREVEVVPEYTPGVIMWVYDVLVLTPLTTALVTRNRTLSA